jgi:hypothetical protein
MRRLTALSRRTKLVLGALGAVVVLGAGGGAAIAAFVATTSNPGNTFSAAGSFASQSVFTGYNLSDRSSGTATNLSDTTAFDDTRFFNTTTWATTYAANRYIDFDMNAPLPPGRQLPTLNFRMRFASGGGAGSGNACFYFEVRRISTGAVLGTHGSSGSPIACSAGTTQLTSTTDISADVASTTIANDLRIRVFGIETGARDWNVDSATVTGSTPLTSFTLYSEREADASDTTPATTTWGMAVAGDGASYQSNGTWPTAVSATRYMDLTFPAYVPAGSTVGTVSFTYSYRSANSGDQMCWGFQVYNGATLIGTHGTSGSPVSCNNTTSFVTDVTPLPEVDTVAEANNVMIRIYKVSSGGRRSLTDYAGLTVNY